MSGKLNNKIALITGGHSGIGLATAKRFVDEGAFVFIAGRRRAELEKAKDIIGRNVAIVQADITQPKDLDRVFNTIRNEKGSLDIIVASAGMLSLVPIEKVTPELFDQVFDANVKGPYFLIQQLLPLLRSGASVVLVSSVAGLIGAPAHSVYGASKAAIRSLGRTLAGELNDRNIRVNTLTPGPVDTPIFNSLADTADEIKAIKDLNAASNPMKRMGRPEELAAAALFLASDESSFSTGIELVCDGGLTQL